MSDDIERIRADYDIAITTITTTSAPRGVVRQRLAFGYQRITDC